MTDAEIAGIMGWHGPGAYTEASLRKIRRIIEQVQAKERADIDAKLTAARRDAERYQWLRARHVDAGFVEVPEIKCWPDGTKAYRRIGGYGAELDKQIDAAMLAAAPATEKEGE